MLKLPVVVTKMSAMPSDVVEAGDLVALHRGLQRADRVDLGDDDASALAGQRRGAALAHVAEAGDDGDLAADEDVGRAVEAVEDRVAAAVLVVELGLGDRVVDVDRREEQVTGGGQLVEAEDTGRGLLGDTLDLGSETLVHLVRVGLEGLADELLEDPDLLGVRRRRWPAPVRRPPTRDPCARAWWRRHRRRGSCWRPRHPAR